MCLCRSIKTSPKNNTQNRILISFAESGKFRPLYLRYGIKEYEYFKPDERYPWHRSTIGMPLLQWPYLTWRSWLFEKGTYEQDPWDSNCNQSQSPRWSGVIWYLRKFYTIQTPPYLDYVLGVIFQLNVNFSCCMLSVRRVMSDSNAAIWQWWDVNNDLDTTVHVQKNLFNTYTVK